jgi:hypothetical protein
MKCTFIHSFIHPFIYIYIYIYGIPNTTSLYSEGLRTSTFEVISRSTCHDHHSFSYYVYERVKSTKYREQKAILNNHMSLKWQQRDCFMTLQLSTELVLPATSACSHLSGHCITIISRSIVGILLHTGITS